MITPNEYTDVVSMIRSYREVSARLNPVKIAPIVTLENENKNENEDEVEPAPPLPEEDRIAKFLREVNRLPPTIIKTRLSTKRVCEIVAVYYGLEYTNMMRGVGRYPNSLYRQIAMYVAWSTMKVTYIVIGRSIKGYDHSTILHGIRKVKKLRKADRCINEDIDNILAYVRNTYVTITET